MKTLPTDPSGVLEAQGHDLEYNGQDQVVADAQIPSGTDYTGTIDYSLDGGNSWNSGNSYEVTDTGSYPVKFRLTGTGNYTGEVFIDVTGSITQKALPEDPDLALDATGHTRTYNGEQQVVAEAHAKAPYTGTVKYSIDNGSNWLTANEFKAMNAGTYPVLFKLEGTGNWTGSTLPKEVEGKINAQGLPTDPQGVIDAIGYTQTYNSTEQLVAQAKIAANDQGYEGTFTYTTDTTITPFTEWKDGSQFKATDSKEYPVTFRLTGTGNYQGTVDMQVTGEIVPAQVAGNLVVAHYTKEYNGQAQVVSEAAIKEDSGYTGTIDYTVDNGATWTEASQYEGVEVGDYPVTWRLTGTGNFTGVEELQATGTITPKDITTIDPDAIITSQGYTQIYNGSDQVVAQAQQVDLAMTGTIWYKIPGGVWTEASDFKAKDVNTYEVEFRFVASGNYEGTVYPKVNPVFGEITPAALPPNASDYLVANGYTQTYNGSSQLVADAKVKDGSEITGSFTYTPEGGGFIPGSEYKGVTVGSYPVTFTFTADGNYYGTSTIAAEGIIKPTSLPEGLNEALIATGYTKTYNGAAQVVADAEIKPGTDITGVIYYTTDNPLSPTAQWLKADSYSETDAGSYGVTFRLDGTGNYTGTVYSTATGHIKPAKLPSDGNAVLTATGYTQIYSGSEQVVAHAALKDGVAYTGKISASADGNSWTDGNVHKQTSVGAYPVTFRMVGTGNYEGTTYVTAVGYIKEAESKPEPPIIINPPTIIIQPPTSTVIVNPPAEITVVSPDQVINEQLESQSGNIVEDIADNKVPLGQFSYDSEKAWSILNLLIALVALVFSISMIVVTLIKRRKQNKAKEANQEEADRREDAPRSSAGVKALGILAAVLGVLPSVAFLILEEIGTLPMIFINENTLPIALLAGAFLAVFVAYLVVRGVAKKKGDKNEEAAPLNNPEGAPLQA